MRETVNTCDISLIKSGRRVGNTTRQIDFAIQALFDGKIVQIASHEGSKGVYKGYLFDAISRRLYSEHRILVNTDYIVRNKSNYTMYLTDKYLDYMREIRNKNH